MQEGNMKSNIKQPASRVFKRVKFCKDCDWSKPEYRSEWCNRCYNPQVVAKNNWALGNNCDNEESCGVSCSDERNKKWFAACGMKGKLWVSGIYRNTSGT